MAKIISWGPKPLPVKKKKKKKRPKKYYRCKRKKRRVVLSAEEARAQRAIKKTRVIKRRDMKTAVHLKFNRRKRLIIFAGVENRLTLAGAASLAGITQKTVYKWMAKGKDQEKYPTYYFFRRKVKRIQAQIEQESLDIIRSAAKGGTKIIDTSVSFGPKGTEIKRRTKSLAPSWNAAAWFLERRYRDQYGKDVVDPETERSAEDFANEIREAAKVLFDSVPICPPNNNLQEVKSE